MVKIVFIFMSDSHVYVFFLYLHLFNVIAMIVTNVYHNMSPQLAAVFSAFSLS